MLSDQVPLLAISVCPSCAVPEIKGAAVLVGLPTVGVGLELAAADPAEFEAVTTTTSAFPTSPLAIVYVDCVAPGMFWQCCPFLSQLCH